MRGSRRLLDVSKIAVDLSAYDTTQVNFLAERCIAVDENDKVLGAISKRDAHFHKSMTLHRAFSIFAFTPDKKLILQRRSFEKITFPGLWTNTCCSHPLYTEKEIDGVAGAKKASIRKLDHELGIKVADVDDFLMCGRFLYRAEMKDAPWGEHELDYALVLRNVKPDLARPNQNEVCDMKTVDRTQLLRLIDHEPESFTPWMRLFARNTKLEKWWNSLDNIDFSEDTQIYHL